MTKADLAFLHARGIDVAPETLDRALADALRDRQARVAASPGEELTEDEARLLAAGGLDLSPDGSGAGALATTAVDYAALIKTSLSTRATAERLGKDASRVRQRIAAGTLYAFRVDGDWLLPTFQFAGDDLVPGISHILPHLPTNLHPLKVERFFSLPNPDLVEGPDERPASPRDWLLAGGAPERVIAVVKAL